MHWLRIYHCSLLDVVHLMEKPHGLYVALGPGSSLALSEVFLLSLCSALNFSLTLSDFVTKTIRSPIISSGSLKLQSWDRIRNAPINFFAVSDEPGKHMICCCTYVTPKRL